MMRTRYVYVLLGALAFPVIQGCTYLEVSADQAKGGPKIREDVAQETLDAAKDTGQGLQTDRDAVAEERARQDRELADLNQRLGAQEAKISRARAENKITRAKEQAMREEIMSLDRDVQDVKSKLEAARVNADAEQEEVLGKRLAALEGKASELDREIDLLSQ
jgi:septal ring factor EnvC (AmiA/AmiB activator)